MTVKDLADKLELKVLTGGIGLQKTVAGGYTGDLLSWVMACLPADYVWLTVMGNVNVIAVATLKNAACVILTDSAGLDDEAKKKARKQRIVVLSSGQNSYELSAALHALLL